MRFQRSLGRACGSRGLRSRAPARQRAGADLHQAGADHRAVRAGRNDRDILARLIGPKLQDAIGQPVVVENKTGAGGNIGADIVAKADKDGHTLLLIDVSTLAISPNLLDEPDLQPDQGPGAVGMILFAPYVLAVHPSLPVKTVAELVAHAKANPGKIPFGNAGIGVANHISAVQLEKTWGVAFKHVPYRGGADAIKGYGRGREPSHPQRCDRDRLVRGAGPAARTGGIRRQRVDSIKELPSFKELNVTPTDVGSWQGLLTTAGTPAPVQERLNAELNKILAMPDIAKRIAGSRRRGEGRSVCGVSPSGSRPIPRATRPSSRTPASRCSEAHPCCTGSTSRSFAFGLFLIALALVAFSSTSALNIGTAADMGPGFVPRTLAWIILAFGAAFCVTSLLKSAPEPLPELAWRPLLAILASIALFAVLFSTLGLIAACIGACWLRERLQPPCDGAG